VQQRQHSHDADGPAANDRTNIQETNNNQAQEVSFAPKAKNVPLHASTIEGGKASAALSAVSSAVLRLGMVELDRN